MTLSVVSKSLFEPSLGRRVQVDESIWAGRPISVVGI